MISKCFNSIYEINSLRKEMNRLLSKGINSLRKEINMFQVRECQIFT